MGLRQVGVLGLREVSPVAGGTASASGRVVNSTIQSLPCEWSMLERPPAIDHPRRCDG